MSDVDTPKPQLSRRKYDVALILSVWGTVVGTLALGMQLFSWVESRPGLVLMPSLAPADSDTAPHGWTQCRGGLSYTGSFVLANVGTRPLAIVQVHPLLQGLPTNVVLVSSTERNTGARSLQDGESLIFSSTWYMRWDGALREGWAAIRVNARVETSRGEISATTDVSAADAPFRLDRVALMKKIFPMYSEKLPECDKTLYLNGF